MITKTLSEAELRAIADQIKVLCCSKPGIKVFCNSRRIYVVERPGQPDYWTHNESQVIEMFNAMAALPEPRKGRAG